jgi:hypothetical protein|tara:strand:- start:500 stop:682 length:183 start_codon:yes stop_codon:yes gene_type:complete
MVKTYTINITYEATLTTEENYTEEDIENGLWLGDLEIGTLGYNRVISIRGDAVDYEIQEE